MEKFKFNREEMWFVKDIPTIRRRIWVVLKYLVISVLLSILYYFVLSDVIYIGEDRRLQRQNKAMRAEYELLKQRLAVLEGTVQYLQDKDRKIYSDVFNANPPVNLLESVGAYDSAMDLDTIQDNTLAKYIAAGVDRAEVSVSEVKTLIDSVLSALGFLGASSRNIPSIVPVKNFSPDLIGASVGKKINPFYKSVMAHNGIDLLGASGTEIVAPADGVVERSSDKDTRSSGNTFYINHLNGYKTRYSNVGEVYVRPGQKVSQGMVIGRIGVSGMSLAPHLHYEVVFNGRYMDPVHYFFASVGPRTYAEAVNSSQNTGQSLD